MGVDPISIGLGISAVSSLYGAYQGNKQGKKQDARMGDISRQAMGMYQQGPSQMEQMLMGSYGNRNGFDPMSGFAGFNMPQLGATPNINIGQDGILQSMRTSPYDKTMQANLTQLLSTGSPYDTGGLFDAIEGRATRDLGTQMAATRAGVSGLGQRFGGAMMKSSQELQRQSLEDTALRMQSIGLQSHEAAQNRRLGAAGAINAQGQLQLGRDMGALGGMNDFASLGLQGWGMQTGAQMDMGRLGLDRAMGMGQLGMQQDQGNLQWLNAMSGMESGRYNRNMGVLGMQAGLPYSQGSAGASAGQDIGQLLFLYGMMNRQQPGTTPYQPYMSTMQRVPTPMLPGMWNPNFR